MITKLEGHALYPIAALSIATGMRRGELLGLQWGDVDLDNATIRVERSEEETRAGLRVKSPKTKRGRRNIALPPYAIAILQPIRSRTWSCGLRSVWATSLPRHGYLVRLRANFCRLIT